MRFGPARAAATLIIACVALAACGDENLEPVLDTSPTQPPPPTTTNPDKPAVSIPTELPTELVITDLIEGTGEPAKPGDTVTVNYVGVRSVDGTEFDNSYDPPGQPFPVTLGEGSVIRGWDEGLIGVKAGGRRQLDIPAEMAYGDAGRGDVIRPGDALTFVIDVESIEPGPPIPTLAPMADASDCPADDGSSEPPEFTEYPPTCIDVAKTYTAEIVTNKGPITVELDPAKAPITVNSFVTLARYGYFDDTSCLRIIPGFIAQCGDPTGTGSGGPGYQFADELPEPGEYRIGSLAMANAGPNTNGSQFFIITGDTGVNLPPDYSLFGMVTKGLDTTLPAIDAVGNPEGNGVPPLEPVTIESITITES